MFVRRYEAQWHYVPCEQMAQLPFQPDGGKKVQRSSVATMQHASMQHANLRACSQQRATHTRAGMLPRRYAAAMAMSSGMQFGSETADFAE